MAFNFETKVFKKEKIQIGRIQEYIVKGGRHLFPLLPKAFEGIQQIGVIGWGPQAKAQAQNLRDSLKDTNIHVKIGLRNGSLSWSKAEQAGFTVASNGLGEMMQVVGESDLVILLIADAAQPKVFREIFKHLKPEATLGFSHGFLSGYLDATDNAFPKENNIIGVCPKGMGPSVRRLYQQAREVNGAGINTSFAVEQDINGRATDYALGWSVAIGTPYTFMTSMDMEYRSDMFGERGILLGAVHGIVESVFRRFCAAGMPVKAAYINTVESITGPISKGISKKGIIGVYEGLDRKDRSIFNRIYAATYPPAFEMLTEIYEEVASGNEIRSIILAGNRLSRFPMSKIDNTFMWQVGKDVRKEREKESIPLNPFIAGIYIGTMMAQIDVLLQNGHAYSEVVNESIIEAVDSLNPYMHYKGVSYMIDNCSTTARLGARKWAPRFDYMLHQRVYPVIDDQAPVDGELINQFKKHEIHQAFSVISKLRPSVDISVVEE